MVKVTYYNRNTRCYTDAFTDFQVVFTSSGIEFEGTDHKYYVDYVDISHIEEVE